jgi:hypothetical protein
MLGATGALADGAGTLVDAGALALGAELLLGGVFSELEGLTVPVVAQPDKTTSAHRLKNVKDFIENYFSIHAMQRSAVLRPLLGAGNSEPHVERKVRGCAKKG